MPGKPILKLDSFVPYRLSIASNIVSEVIASAYRSLFGISVAEWRLITVLAERDRATQLELGQVTLMDKVTVSRAAVELVERGLAARESHPEDRRSHLLYLTKAGRALYAQVAPQALDLEKTLLSGFSAAEVKQLNQMLRRLETAAVALRIE